MTKDQSKAKFDNIDPELRRMIEDKTLKTITIKDAAMRLKDGNLILRASDLLPKEKTPKNPDDPEATKEPMTPAQRQKKLYEERKAEGWKKQWMTPDLIMIAEQLGGVEHVAPSWHKWMHRAVTAETQLMQQQEQRQPRRWWKFW